MQFGKFTRRTEPGTFSDNQPDRFVPSSITADESPSPSSLGLDFQPTLDLLGRQPEVEQAGGGEAYSPASTLPPGSAGPDEWATRQAAPSSAESDQFTLEQWLSGIGLHWEPAVKTPSADAAPQDAQAEPEVGGFTPLELRDRVVIMLLFKELIRVDQVEKAWRKWKKMADGGSGESLWRVLAEEQGVEAERVYAEAAEVYAFKKASLSRSAAVAFIQENRNRFAEAQWAQLRDIPLMPIGKDYPQGREERWIFATHDPTNPEVGKVIHSLRLTSVEIRYMARSAISSIISDAFPRRNEYLERVSGNGFAYDLGATFEKQNSQLLDEEALEAEIGRSALINLFEATLVEAVHQGASDIHIFPNARKATEIHFRMDGELTCWHIEERVHPEAFIAVVKDNSINVDRFERDAAQDGFIQRWVDETLIRFRVSILPIASSNQEIRAESVVIRILDDRKVITNLKKLGMAEKEFAIFHHAITQPYGMVILTGPTGSGKTTTLYAALSQVVTPKVNVLTIEDPVEYVIPGVRQIKLNHKLGLESALRSVLRHDPDVVMVGEMRDAATADLAIKLSNTGHLTFSTLHTNDATSAINRLYKMGIEPFLIAYTINLVVAQRLVRTLCPQCKAPDEDPDAMLLERMGFEPEDVDGKTLFKPVFGKACPVCQGAGYKGRKAIMEMLPMSDEVRHIILRAKDVVDEGAIRKQAEREGMVSLQASARALVCDGLSSLQEIMRVVAGK